MSTKLKAGTATSGAVIDADATGILELQSGSTPTTAITVDASQNVGIGTTSPTNFGSNFRLMEVKGSDYGVIQATSTSGSTTIEMMGASGTGYLGTRTNHPLVFRTNDTERMRIDTSGNLFLGQTAYTTPPTQTVDFFSGGLIINPSRRTTGSAANCNWDGTTGVFYRSTSSLRYKTDIQDASYGLSDVLKLRPVTYKGKSETDGDKVFGGFIAEEIDALGLKQFVEYDAEGNPDSLAYANMVSLLTKAIQELNAKVEALEAQLGAK